MARALNDQTFNALAQRCGALGLHLWPADQTGRPVDGPQGPIAEHPLLAGPAAIQRLAAAVEQCAAHEGLQNQQPIPLDEHAWLLPVPDGRDRATRVAAWALALPAEAPDGAFLRGLCEQAGADVSTLETLRPHLSHGPVNAGHLATALQWAAADLTRQTRQHVALEQFGDQLSRSYEQITLLYRFARLMNATNDARQGMQMLCDQLHAVLELGWATVAFVPDPAIPDLDDAMFLAGDLPCERPRFEQLVRVYLRGAQTNDWTRVLDPQKDELAQVARREVAAEPVTHDGRVVGVLLAANPPGPECDVSSELTQFLDAAADYLGVFHENLARFQEQRVMFMGTLQALTAAIDAKDRYTCGHTERVAMLSARLAQAMGMSAQEVEHVRIAGLVHDVGKIGVPESVLCKPGRLTDEEFEQIKRHPTIGHNILKDIPPLEPMLPGVLYHHERWDGRGYPEGLAGEDIPLLGRIIACADTFDAMRSTRSYRSARTSAETLVEMNRCAGSQFDPNLIPIFVKLDFTEYDQMVERHEQRISFAA
jgi:HD-GYP domain-containing protein (c-di-GMP phosphodiesterase class II)